MRINFSKFFNAVSNLRNWPEYVFHKREVQKRLLHFTTRPFAIKMEVNAENYPVFKEIFVEDFYRTNKLFSNLPSKINVIDIGANEGFFAALVLSKIKDAMIYAFEPLPSNVRKIERLREINPSEKNKIIVHAKAVTDGNSETVQLFTQQENAESSIASIYREFDERNSNSMVVPATTLMKIMADNNLDEVNLLKLDCEGAEYEILYNTNNDVLKKIKRMLIEVHPLDNETRNEKFLSSFLTDHGFSTETTPFHNGCYSMIAEQN